MRLLIHLALGLFLFVSRSVLAADEGFHPLLQGDQWQLEDPAAWEWQGDGEATTLVLKKPSSYKPKVRRPFNLAWIGGAEWDSFTLTCEARMDVFNKGNNDLCIAFAGHSDSEFYYAHLGETADAVHLHLHVVNHTDRKAITTTRAKTLPWQPNHWHQIKLVRDASVGSIKVWFDEQLVLEATDKTFGKGRIGLGSFDDLGAFRKIVVLSHNDQQESKTNTHLTMVGTLPGNYDESKVAPYTLPEPLRGHVRVLNNILVAAKDKPLNRVNGDFPDVLLSHNLFHGDTKDIVPGDNAIIADPLFKDGSKGDFHLTEKSPARNAGGSWEIAPLIDLAGKTRAMDKIDLGALAD